MPSRSEAPAALEPAPAAPLAPPAPARARQCLIVDDSRMIRKVSRRILESLGYEVFEAEDGVEALARCKLVLPSLILLDWNMPVMNGFEFIQQLRRHTNGAMPRVVFCTTENDVDHIRAAAAAGASEYVIKPFDYETLHAKLRNIGAL